MEKNNQASTTTRSSRAILSTTETHAIIMSLRSLTFVVLADKLQTAR
jgi:hypothetical protein